MYKVRFPSGDSPKLRKDGKPYADGRKEKAYVRTVFGDCTKRACFVPMLNKGSFTPGRGYTSYYDNPEWVCRNNHLYGCPPEPERDMYYDRVEI
jgi:hypothetical protein